MSAEWWGRRGTYLPALPPEAALQDVMRDLFAAPELPFAFARGYPSPLKSAPARAATPCAAQSALAKCRGFFSIFAMSTMEAHTACDCPLQATVAGCSSSRC